MHQTSGQILHKTGLTIDGQKILLILTMKTNYYLNHNT